jgi:branched-chain amino acid transport system permease protein
MSQSTTGRRRLDPALITLAAGAIATALVLVFTQLIIDGDRGRGTPVAILFTGLVFGVLVSTVSVGMVLIYRSHRFINFAQPVIGLYASIITYNFAVLNNWPAALAILAGLVVAAGCGLGFQLIFVLRFFNAPRLVLTVLSAAVIPAVFLGVGYVSSLPVFPKFEDRPPEVLQGQIPVPLPFADWSFTLGDLKLPFGLPHLLALGVPLVAFIALAAFLRYSRLGVAIRASAENTDRARSLGISVAALSMIVWTIAGLFSGLNFVLSTLQTGGFGGGGGGDPNAGLALFVLPLAAATLARFQSLPLAIGASVLLSLLRTAVAYNFEAHIGLVDLGFFVLIVVGFLLRRERRGRAEEAEATSWVSMQEQRPVPREMLGVTSVAWARRVLIAIGVGALLLFPYIASSGQTNQAGYLMLTAIAILSLVVLTGWAGQVSLGQWAFVAVGAVVGGALTARVGISFWFAIFLVPAFTAVFAVLMGLPALRIRGLFLAVATLAFAVAVQGTLFNERYFGWLLPSRVERPTLFILDFQDNRSMYYLELLALVVAVLVIVALRRTRPGRILIAMRENENNLRSFGVNPTRIRLAAFAISGLLCGFAGVLVAHHQRGVTQADFPSFLSLQLFIVAVVGGVGSVAGGLLGGLYWALLTLLPQNNEILQLVLGPLGTLLVLYMAPGGLASVVTGLRDGILRIVAQRRQMVVPSLMPDYDPELVEKQLIPLAEPIPGAGLEALPSDVRYTATSRLYAERGRPDGVRRRRSGEETAALGAAAQSFGGEEPAEAVTGGPS